MSDPFRSKLRERDPVGHPIRRLTITRDYYMRQDEDDERLEIFRDANYDPWFDNSYGCFHSNLIPYSMFITRINNGQFIPEMQVYRHRSLFFHRLRLGIGRPDDGL